MWHDWFLDFEQIMNHRQMPVMVSDRDEDLLISMVALKGREGASGQVGWAAGRQVGVGGSYDLGVCVRREPLERKNGRC